MCLQSTPLDYRLFFFLFAENTVKKKFVAYFMAARIFQSGYRLKIEHVKQSIEDLKPSN